MKKSKIVLIVVFFVAAVVVGYFTYGVVKNRYFSPRENSAEMKDDKMQNQSINQIENQADNEFENNVENVSSDIDSFAPGEGRPDIQSADCENDCANFKNDENYLKYCREVCGDRPVVKKESDLQCENLSGLAKDSCWRDLAVSKKDFAICDKISDEKLKRVCKNRVTEEVLD